MNVEEQIGIEIVSARKAAGMSQSELAVKVGVPRCTISRIESGKVSASVGLLDRIAFAVGKRIALADYEQINH